MDDGHDVLDHLLAGLLVRSCRIGHDDGSVKRAADEGTQLEAEAAEAVALGNGNNADLAAHDAFQKPLEPASLVVEARADVLDDLVAGVPAAHVLDLPLEVLALLGGRDSAVDDFRFPGREVGRVVADDADAVLGGGARGDPGACCLERPGDVVAAVSSWRPGGADAPVVGPVAERVGVDMKSL